MRNFGVFQVRLSKARVGRNPNIPGSNFAIPPHDVDQDGFLRCRATKQDCEACSLKPRCCPGQPARKIPQSIHQGARDMARDLALTDVYVTSRRRSEPP